MSDLKNELEQLFDKLKGLEERARKLKNQNLADIATSARAKVQQLSEHADLALVDDRKDQTASDEASQQGDVGALQPGDPNAAPAPFPSTPPTPLPQSVTGL